jgi:phospholipase/carboxylesterase
MVPLAWGKHSFDELQKLGVKGEFVPLKNTMHEIKKREFVQLSEWIEKKLPPLEKDLGNKL